MTFGIPLMIFLDGLIDAEMLTFRNQTQVKCELSFAECANKLGVLGARSPLLTHPLTWDQ